ncbi:hypothetical protein LSUB1_G006316 [Lachnellula subtilissima]|uniref:Uncharacterized protein n=1 Tax=Lachnellula subtilissima TaxID=602034 RepID=A0A8H8U946_9HELO|nr:hypothetical protein LSUB1_G006316 [Lachnellula subtilissima]
MAFRGVPRDGDGIGEAVTTDRAVGIRSPNPSARGHAHTRTNSRLFTEIHELLQSPRSQFENDATANSRTPAPPIIDNPNTEKKKPILEPDWASIPESLGKGRTERVKMLILDVILIAISIPFFVLAGVVIVMDGESVDLHPSNALDQCIKCAATLFPLLFSFIVGRAIIKFASWTLERGSTLGNLESLMGSRTVIGAIVTQLQLWPLKFLGLALIALWCMSPLGSQGILRMLSTTDRLVSVSSNVGYASTRQAIYSADLEPQNTWLPGFASLFGAALVAPIAVKTSAMDLWGNVKIPLLSNLSGLPQDVNGWQKVPQNNHSLAYPSLFGIPISSLPAGNTTFNVESTYLELACSNRSSTLTRLYAPNSTQGGVFYNPGLISTYGPFRSGLDINSDTAWAIGYLGTDLELLLPSPKNTTDQCLDCLPTNLTTTSTLPAVLLYQEFEGAHNVTSIYCTPSQAYVESIIFCTQTSTDQSCTAIAQRPSLLSHAPSTITSLGFSSVLNSLSELLPLSVLNLSGVDTMQNYIISPLDNKYIESAQMPRKTITPATSNISSPETESRLLDLPLEDFSIRLSQILNAYLQGSTQNSTTYLTGSPLPPSSILVMTSAELASQVKNPTITVPANTTQLIQVFSTSYPWLLIFLLSNTVLLLSAIAAALLSRLTLARDYLPYVSSLLRESQFSSMPRGGVRRAGLARSRDFRALKVRLGDVGDVAAGWRVGTGVTVSVGRMAVGDWDGDGDGREWGVERVRGGKWYL